MIRISIYLALFFLAACTSVQVNRYYTSPQNTVLLRDKIGSKKLYISKITEEKVFKENCYGMIFYLPEQKTMGEFVKEAINDELRVANVYSEHGEKWSGRLIKSGFSEMSGLWFLDLELKNDRGRIKRAKVDFKYKAGAMSQSACHATAQALIPAVQELVKKLF